MLFILVIFVFRGDLVLWNLSWSSFLSFLYVTKVLILTVCPSHKFWFPNMYMYNEIIMWFLWVTLQLRQFDLTLGFCMYISLLQETLDVKSPIISCEESKVASDGVHGSVLMVSEIKLGYIDTWALFIRHYDPHHIRQFILLYDIQDSGWHSESKDKAKRNCGRQ